MTIWWRKPFPSMKICCKSYRLCFSPCVGRTSFLEHIGSKLSCIAEYQELCDGRFRTTFPILPLYAVAWPSCYPESPLPYMFLPISCWCAMSAIAIIFGELFCTGRNPWTPYCDMAMNFRSAYMFHLQKWNDWANFRDQFSKRIVFLFIFNERCCSRVAETLHS